MTFIKLEKISGKNNASIPVGYWIEGYTQEYPKADPKAEQMVHLSAPIRSSWNEHFHWFHTSAVLEVKDGEIHTQNSVWKIIQFTP